MSLIELKAQVLNREWCTIEALFLYNDVPPIYDTLVLTLLDSTKQMLNLKNSSHKIIFTILVLYSHEEPMFFMRSNALMHNYQRISAYTTR